ncbi:MAG: membrane dipeptidase [Polyangiaceae bacterium]|nr:membrane dipeptidase [Polyangiaceae bacterium]MCL4751987.1 membrane dipeptidase [Myxococcales bacterium]
MTRAVLLPLAALCLSLLPLPVAGAPVAERPLPVVDLNVHLPYQLVAQGRSLTHASGQADAPRLRRGGVIGVVLPLVGGERRARPEPAYHTLYRALWAGPELRIPGCRRPGPGIRTWLALEGGATLAAAPTSAGLWATRGVRLFGLVHDRDGELATSAMTPPPVLTGLTPLGREVTRKVYAAGGVVDVSHASEMTLRDVLEIARETGAPVVASHANARALAEHPRNLTDSQLADIGRSGGVVGISFHRRLLARGREAELSHVVAHIRHVAKVAGIDAVAIGSGFEGGITPPHALLNATRFPRLGQALADSGMPRHEVRKVLAGNALRVLCPSKAR